MYSLIFALILTFPGAAFAGVTADDLVLDPGADLRGESRVDEAALARDIAVLKAALAKGYAGPNFTRALNSVALTETDSQGFCERLSQVFSSVRDAHLRAAVEFRNCGPRLERGRVGANVAAGQDKWVLQSVSQGGVRVDVLGVPNFWPKFDARWNGFLETVRDLRAKGRPFILDLRGNAGGDDSMGFEFARLLLGLPEFVNLPSPVASRKFLQSPESFALQSNYWAWSMMKLRAEGKSVPVYMTQRREELLDWMKRAQDGQFPAEYVETLPEEKLNEAQIFSANVFVLTDRACASACETTLQVLESLPGRVLVGEKTLGAVEYGEVGRVVLPNSKVSVSLSTMNVRFRDGRHPEKSGYAPDVPVAAGRDALEAALQRF